MTINKRTYRAADRRIRQGNEQHMDFAICEVYRLQEYGAATEQSAPRTIWDLPIARVLYEADRRQFGGEA